MKSTSNTSSETSEESTWGHLSSFQEAGVSEKNHFMSMDAIYDVGVSVLVLRLNKLNKGIVLNHFPRWALLYGLYYKGYIWYGLIQCGVK